MSNTIPANNNTGLYNATGNAVPTTGNITTNNITATGNVTVDGFITANGSITTNANFVGNLVGNVTGNITLAGGNTEVIYNDSGVTGSSPAFTFNESSNVVSVIGNIAGTYFIGNGSQLTGITAGTNYSNANVEAYLPTFSGNLGNVNIVNASGNVNGGNLVSAGNVSGSYIFGNGSQLTGLPATYGNANVAAYLPTYTGNITANIISTTGNIVTAANLVTSGAGGNIVGANYVSANFYLGDGSQLTNLPAGVLSGNLTGNLQGNSFGANAFSFVSATGNVTGNYILGNGSQLTGIAASYGNSNVATFLAAFGSNTVSTTGNISAGNVLLGDLLGAGNVTATGNVTGAYIVGNGSALTSITGANVTGTVANATFATSSGTATSATTAATVTSNAQANITSVGTLTSLAVTGNITTGNILTDNYLYANGSPINFAGTYGNSNVASFMAAFGSNTISTTGTVNSGNVTGTNLFTAGVVSATGNVTGANIVSSSFQAVNSGGGALKNAAGTSQLSWGAGGGDNLALNVSTNLNGANAQIDISPTGTGHVHIKPTGTGAVEIAPTSVGSINNMIIGNVTPLAISATTVSATGNVTGANILTAGIVSATGNVTGNYIIGNGSQLTGIAASTYGDSNVATFLGAFGSNTISTTGNATVGNIIATNIGNVAALNLNANASQVLYGNGVFAAVAGGGTYGDSNVATFLGAFGSNSISTTGTVTTGNVVGSNIATAGIITATGNIISSGNINAAGVSTTGNVTIDGGAYRTTAATAFVVNTNATTVNIGGAANVALNMGNTAGNTNVRGNVTIGGSNVSHTFTGNLVTFNPFATFNGGANIGSANGLNVNSGNIVVSSGNLTLGGANGAAYLKTTSVAGYVFNTANTVVLGNVSANVGNVTTGANISAVGSVTGGNLLTAGVVSATGNVTGNYILGNGSQLTGLPATYSDSNVATFLGAFGSNTISTTGNVTVSNLNLSGQIYDSSGVLQLNGSGNIVLAPSGSTITDSPISATANVTGGNLLTAGIVSATGNVSGNFFIGNGSQLTGVSATPGGSAYQFQYNNSGAFGGIPNTNYYSGNGTIEMAYTKFEATGSSGIITVPGTTGYVSVVGNTTVGNLLTGGIVSAVGNITGSYLFGNGSQLTGIAASTYGDSNVATFLGAFGSNSISTTGNVTTTNLTLPALSRIYGDFSNSATNSRTYFQTSNVTGTTFTGAIPGNSFTLGSTNGSGVTAFAGPDPGNSPLIGIYCSNTTAAINSRSFGTATAKPIAFQISSSTKMTLDVNGNLGIANTAPVDTLAVTGTAYLGGNVTMTALATVGTYTVAALTAITGVSGQYAAVSNGTAKNNGQLAYWDVTNTRWSWVDSNLAVT